jgi:hypothetical protein
MKSQEDYLYVVNSTATHSSTIHLNENIIQKSSLNGVVGFAICMDRPMDSSGFLVRP